MTGTKERVNTQTPTHRQTDTHTHTHTKQKEDPHLLHHSIIITHQVVTHYVEKKIKPTGSYEALQLTIFCGHVKTRSLFFLDF